MKQAYDAFVSTPGAPPSWQVKELWNMACASYYSGEEPRALDEFKRVLPQLPASFPQLVDPCKEKIAEIQQSMSAGPR